MLSDLMKILRSSRSCRFAGAAVIGLLLAVAHLPARAAIQSVQLNDPADDVAPSGGPNIVSIVTEYDDDVKKITSITINFSTPVKPTSFDEDSLAGVILIDLGADTDLAADLGRFPLSHESEYYVDLFAAGTLTVPLVDSSATAADVLLPIEYLDSFMTLKIGFSLANVSTGRGFAVGAIVGSFLGPTDQAPNLTAVVPEPASFAAWTLAAIGIAFTRRRRRHFQ